MKKFSLIIILSLLISSLLGCGNRSPKTEYYILSSKIPAIDIEVDYQNKIKLFKVNIPSYLDRNSIVLRNSSGVKLDIAEYNVWAENLDRGIERILKDVLRPELALYQITFEQRLSGNNIPQLSLDILRFDSTLGADSVLEAYWILSGKNGEMLDQGFFYNKIPSGNTFESLVKAQSELIVLLGKSMIIPLSKTFITTDN